MFGIGLPELILIMAVALIVVGPEKLPDLARGLAKQFFELKKAANVLKDSLQEEENSGKPTTDLTSSVGFSRPEQLAAAAFAAQGRQPAEPGSPRPEALDLIDAAPQAETVPGTPQAESGPGEAEDEAEPRPPTSPLTGEPPGPADVRS